jgi:hypothetical protein
VQSCSFVSDLISVQRRVLSSRILADSTMRQRLVISFCVLGLASDEALSELIITITILKTSQQVLAVYVLNNWPLVDACQTLEDATTSPVVIYVDVHNSFRVAFPFDPSCLLSARLLARDVRPSGYRGMLTCNLIEVSLLLRHQVEVSDQV